MYLNSDTMSKKGYILMLEKDEHDLELTSNYFDAMHIPAFYLQQSNQVIPFLNQTLIERSELPALVLLSMNSVPDSGLEVLKQIKGSRHFKHIPVVILGENTQRDLINQCYAEGVNTFINKPLSNKRTDVAIKAFLLYWFEVAELGFQSRLQYS